MTHDNGFVRAIIALTLVMAFTAEGRNAYSETPAPYAIDRSVMRSVYNAVKTPYKYGVVISDSNGMKVDSPSVFRHDGLWYMIYIRFNDTGYETLLAESDDLLHWRTLGTVMKQGSGAWDDKQVAGYIALQDWEWGGSYGIEPYDGVYWMSYLGGALEGYETDPLSVGIASTSDPVKAVEWDRVPENPVLSPHDNTARWFEATTLYKSTVIHVDRQITGHPFVMFYNGKEPNGTERIGMAVSDDMREWRRYGLAPLIDNGSGISGDPQITRIGDVWVMFYFGAFWQPGAFDTFACSRDLVHWTKWDGPHLIEPSEPWDKTYAHKPWIVKHDGIVYHYYCAVGDRGRVIALATSKDVGTSPLNVSE